MTASPQVLADPIDEAVAQALGILEGEEVSVPLLDFYRRATDRMLMVRGKMRLGDVYGGAEAGSRAKVLNRTSFLGRRVKQPEPGENPPSRVA